MTRALLDVNVLLALLDAGHTSHERALDWVRAEEGPLWASCAVTQNGFVRVISQHRYPQPVPVVAAVERLSQRCALDDHEFWHCDVSLLDSGVIDTSAMLGPRTVTDVYLLALAVARGGRLVTLDRSVPLWAVRGATEEHLLVL